MALYKLKRGTAKVLRCFSPRAIKNAMTRISSRFSKPTPVEGTITIHTIPPRATNSAISLSNTGTENTLSTTSTAVDLHDLVNWADFTGGTPRPDDAIHVCTQASMFAFSFRGGTPAQPAYFRATQKTQTFLHPSRGDREIIEVVYNLFQHQHLTWPQVFLILCVPNELLLRLSQANRDVVAAFMRRNYEILMSEELIRRFLHAPQFPSPVCMLKWSEINVSLTDDHSRYISKNAQPLERAGTEG